VLQEPLLGLLLGLLLVLQELLLLRVYLAYYFL
jgi:hypothetical protein